MTSRLGRRLGWTAGILAAAFGPVTLTATAAPEPTLAVADGVAEIRWLRTFASDKDDWINDIVPLHDGRFLAVGFLNRLDGSPPSDWRALTVKLGEDGAIAWSREYGHGGGIDAFWSAREATGARAASAI